MKKITIDKWKISADEFSEKQQAFYESIFCQGNGYIGVRGLPSVLFDKKPCDKGNYVAGFFEYIKDSITDMVNLPDWFCTKVFLNGNVVSAENGRIEDFDISFDMQNGSVHRKEIYVDKVGNKIRLDFCRIVSWSDKHLGLLKLTVQPLSGDCVVRVVSGLDGRVANRPIADNQMSANNDVLPLFDSFQTGGGGLGGSLCATTYRSKRQVFDSYALSIEADNYTVGKIVERNFVGADVEMKVKCNAQAVIDKFVSVFTYRDDNKDGAQVANDCVRKAQSNGFAKEAQLSADQLQKRWLNADIEIEGDVNVQGAIRYNILQLMMTDDRDDGRVSIGARGIMHGRYKGCYFWDADVFMLPFYLYSDPTAAKNLLMYRYNTLQDAKKSAGWFSLSGARYSWMCSDTGFEQCETWDTGCCEIHITADVAYAVWNYFVTTDDKEFLSKYGCEILVETARYWQSRFTYNAENDVYNLLFVKGPDEYCGVTTNNTYTNYLARHNLICAVEALDRVKQYDPEQYGCLLNKLNVKPEEIDIWQRMIAKIRINYDGNKDLFIQDDTFAMLEPIDVKKYKTSDAPLYRTLSFDRLQRYKVLKQGDLVMLMQLLPSEFTNRQKVNVWNYYEPLTMHDSTLSFGSHAVFAAQLGYMEQAEKYFYKSLYLDLFDVMDNTAVEGIHTASLSCAWQALVFGYCGLQAMSQTLDFEPHLPENIKKVKFNLYFKGEQYHVELTNEIKEITKSTIY